MMDYTRTDLYGAMSPFFISMRICGLHYLRSDKRKYPVNISALYCIVSMILALLILLQNILQYGKDDTFGPQLFMRILILSWFVFCSINKISCLRASFCNNSLSNFFLKWSKIQRSTTSHISYVRTRSILSITLHSIFMVCSSRISKIV